MLTIRKARLDDAALLSGMAYSSYLHHFSHLWHDPKELEAYLHQEFSLPELQQSLRSHESCWFIALDPDEESVPVGFAKVSWRRSLGKDGPTGALLHKLYLLPGKTGKGYGEVFFTEIVHRAREHGETFFWLEVPGSNSPAYRFYTRQGLGLVKQKAFSAAGQKSQLHILGTPL